MESSIKELKEELDGRANIIVINTDHPENAELSQMFSIRVVPTLVFLDKEFELVKAIEGLTSKEDMYQYLTEAGVE